MFHAGAALRDITPSEPMYLGGYEPTRQWTSVHDPLTARALAVSDDRTTAVLVSTDSIAVVHPIALAIREGVAERTGLPVSHIHVASIHTHSAPDTVGIYGGSPESYRRTFVAAAIDAACEAVAHLQPARMRCTQVDVPDGLVMNRRVPAGKTDPQCTIAQFATPDGDTIATLTNLSVHPVCLGPDNQVITADFVHYMRAVVEGDCGGIAVHTNGTEGNMNPAPQLKPDDRLDRTGGTFAQADDMGTRIGRTVVDAICDATWASEPAVAVTAKTCDFPLENPFFVQAAESGAFGREYENGCIQVAIGVLDIGSLRLVLFPGEAFAEIGLEIKTWWPERRTAVVGLCNDLIGYVIPPEIFDASEYEEQVSATPQAWPILERELKALV